mgnify:CR=1 FL=1
MQRVTFTHKMTCRLGLSLPKGPVKKILEDLPIEYTDIGLRRRLIRNIHLGSVTQREVAFYQSKQPASQKCMQDSLLTQHERYGFPLGAAFVTLNQLLRGKIEDTVPRFDRIFPWGWTYIPIVGENPRCVLEIERSKKPGAGRRGKALTYSCFHLDLIPDTDTRPLQPGRFLVRTSNESLRF